MKLYKMIEMCLKYDNMHTIRTINAFLCIDNHVNSCINIMLSTMVDTMRNSNNTFIHFTSLVAGSKDKKTFQGDYLVNC